MKEGNLKIIILMVAVSLSHLPKAHSRQLPIPYRPYTLDRFREQRHSPSLQELLASLSTPELLFLSSRRRMNDREKLVEFIRKIKPTVSLRDSVDDKDAPNPIPIPKTQLSIAEERAIREELDTIHEHGSALLDHPYVEKKGLNDFLVIKPDYIDPFYLYVPNDIYYGHQKSCVNWLDSCNVKGVRQKLLQIINTP